MSSKIVDANGREVSGQREVFHFIGRKADKVVEMTVSTTRGWALARRDFKALHGLRDEEVESI